MGSRRSRGTYKTGVIVRFLKLLDPTISAQNDPSATGRQQQQAQEAFPMLVAHSRLHYWRPQQSIAGGERYLLGLAASFDLKDLRLADLLNDAAKEYPAVTIDVFNVDDLTALAALEQYFPGDPPNYLATPIVGHWRNGVHQETHQGFDARRFILSRLLPHISAEDSIANLSLPEQWMYEHSSCPSGDANK